MAKKIMFGSTETEARKVMNEIRRSMNLPTIPSKKKKAKKRTK